MESKGQLVWVSKGLYEDIEAVMEKRDEAKFTDAARYVMRVGLRFLASKDLEDS